MLTQRERDQFDALVEKVLDELPDPIRDRLEEVPLIVEDTVDPGLMDELALEHPHQLCGLHSGVPLTDRSVEAPPDLPDQIVIYREPIRRLARQLREPTIRQVRITILHEIGHHFGLDEDDLEELGYG